jgi:hypothetical protein
MTHLPEVGIKEPVASVPVGDELRRVGTANQIKISGDPVQGPLFDFAPVINPFLQTHLFGDIFARDNLDWQSRELATPPLNGYLKKNTMIFVTFASGTKPTVSPN